MKAVQVLFAAMLMTSLAQAAEIDKVIVRQQWPWSTDVKVEYRIKDLSGAVDLAVKAYEGDTQIDEVLLASAMNGEIYGVTEATGSFTIDPAIVFGDAKKAISNFRVEVTVKGASAADLDKPIYRVFDLENWTSEALTKRQLGNNPAKYGPVVTDYGKIGAGYTTPLDAADVFIWLGANQDVYKTTKLVMRRIPAKGKTFTFGSVTAGTAVQAKLDKDFWIGIFEVTQKQWELISKTHSSTSYSLNDKQARFSNPDYWEKRPIENISFIKTIWYGGGWSFLEILRGSSTKGGRLYTSTWDAPTEAQWEFAARAGYTGDSDYLPNGKESTLANARELGRLAQYNVGSDYTKTELGNGTTTVGSCKPNAFGLYDMIGNVSEMTYDLWLTDEHLAAFYADKEKPVLNPVVPRNQPNTDQHASGRALTLRGENYKPFTNWLSRRGMNENWNGNSGEPTHGLRLCYTE